MWYIYTTISGKSYPIEIKCVSISSEFVVHDYSRITSYCKTGCKNYNHGGGCPPKAPHFDDIAEHYPYGYIICAILSSEWKPEKVKNSKSPYIHFRSQDVILSNFLSTLGYKLRDKGGGGILFLNNGYCMGCAVKKCSFKEGELFCRNPLRRTFSLEATGVDVEVTLANIFGLKLQWYKNDNYNEVQYMAKSIGLFTKTHSEQIIIQDSLVHCLQALPSTKYKLGSYEFEQILLEDFRISM